jgi:hypothetical protein
MSLCFAGLRYPNIRNTNDANTGGAWITQLTSQP